MLRSVDKLGRFEMTSIILDSGLTVRSRFALLIALLKFGLTIWSKPGRLLCVITAKRWLKNPSSGEGSNGDSCAKSGSVVGGICAKEKARRPRGKPTRKRATRIDVGNVDPSVQTCFDGSHEDDAGPVIEPGVPPT